MSGVIKFPKKTTKIHRLYCDECDLPLSYWLGDDDSAYGLCDRCDLNVPDSIQLKGEETEH
jgi:hypothetical protein